MNQNFWRGKRVFVTGHTGFKGSWLVLLLQSLGARVAGYALAPPTEPSLYALAHVGDGVESTTGDIRDLDALARAMRAFEPEVVLHLAAQSVVLHSYDDPVDTYSTNVIGTVHTLEAVRRLKRPCAVVNVTTDKCYENKGWVWGYRETDALGGHDPYSNSKACAELVGRSLPRLVLSAGAPGRARRRHRERTRRQRDRRRRLDAAPVGARSDGGVHARSARGVAASGCGTPLATRARLPGRLPAPSRGIGRRPGAPRGRVELRALDAQRRAWPASSRRLPPIGDRAPVAARSRRTAPEEMLLRLDVSKASHELGWTPRLPVDEAIRWVPRGIAHSTAAATRGRCAWSRSRAFRAWARG